MIADLRKIIKENIKDGYNLAYLLTELLEETVVYDGFDCSTNGNELHKFHLVLSKDNFLVSSKESKP